MRGVRELNYSGVSFLLKNVGGMMDKDIHKVMERVDFLSCVTFFATKKRSKTIFRKTIKRFFC